METPAKFKPDNYLMEYSQTQRKKTFIEFSLKMAEKRLLPELIRIEKNNGYNQIKGADYLLYIRNNSNWKKCSLGGLRETGHPNYYYSDLLYEGKKSLMAIKIIGDFAEVQIRFCRKFYPEKNPKWRKEIIDDIIDNWDKTPKITNENYQTDINQTGQLELF